MLTFVSILSEGWDSKIASFYINTCPTTSLVKATQRLGRVLRKKPGNVEAVCIDFIDRTAGKRQVTIFEVLGENKVSVGKVYGTNNNDRGSSEYANTYLEGILHPDLYEKLAAQNGRLLAELTISPRQKVEEDIRQIFERMLNHEGLGNDSGMLGIPPDY